MDNKKINPSEYVTLEQAQDLASKGYRGPTEVFWDRYNPNPSDESKPQLDWRLSQSRQTFDDTCCLAAPKVEDYQEVLDGLA